MALSSRKEHDPLEMNELQVAPVETLTLQPVDKESFSPPIQPVTHPPSLKALFAQGPKKVRLCCKTSPNRKKKKKEWTVRVRVDKCQRKGRLPATLVYEGTGIDVCCFGPGRKGPTQGPYLLLWLIDDDESDDAYFCVYRESHLDEPKRPKSKRINENMMLHLILSGNRAPGRIGFK